ncbi:CcdB family protein [Pannonibacter phragmitetus]|uniref:CcdB family protein n=1 Tax=Pannonibacter phragmitetus TaxID=121719 RepID=UPI000F451C0C|nr:CcdB family protein [Pannonibacter phragmitetus]MBA4207279.1 plasmid maintenance protein CcdB [Polymorphum sp.]
MARFDVYPDPSGRGYLLDVQAGVLEALSTRMVVPLFPEDRAPLPARRLNPVFGIAGVRHVMVTQFMASVPRSLLRQPVMNLAAQDAEISNALDMLFSGF